MVNPIYDIALSLLYRNRLRRALVVLDHYGSAQAAWEALKEPDMSACLERAKKEMEWIEAHGIRVWTLADEDYPYRLKQCPDRPMILYSKGHVNPSAGHIVSIVGTRRPTERGKELTTKLVKDLHEQLEQVTIVSGGAYGIDITAHRAAIECGIPTIIIPAHGLDRIYPYSHRPEAVASLTHGGLLTEFPSGIEPMPQNFLQRNRIIAGLADAVVVVESREKGGSLVTARMAVDYNRELFAFPGRPMDISSRGCNNLIQADKAHLIDGAENLIRGMDWRTRNTPVQGVQKELIGLRDDLNPTQQTILEKIQEAEEGLHINHIVMETGLAYDEVSSELVLMELNGLIRSLPGGIYRFVR